MTGHAILTPTLVVISMIIGDALAMSATTDNVHPSPRPNRWQIGHLTIAGVIMGAIDLVFCVAVLAVARYRFGLAIETLRTLTLVTLVFSGQALFYVVRERRRMWASRPSKIVVACSIADLLIIPTLAVTGTLMAPLPVAAVMAILAACVAFALVLDTVKIVIFRHLSVT